MSRIRLYMDEDFTARSLVLALQNRGVDVTTSLIVLIPKDNPWRSLIDSLDNFWDDFMTNCDRPLIDTRESL
jgi:virulence-associated protein VagC